MSTAVRFDPAHDAAARLDAQVHRCSSCSGWTFGPGPCGSCGPEILPFAAVPADPSTGNSPVGRAAA